MDKDTKERIKRLQKQIKDINETIYPDNYLEVKWVMLTALVDRIKAIRNGTV